MPEPGKTRPAGEGLSRNPHGSIAPVATRYAQMRRASPWLRHDGAAIPSGLLPMNTPSSGPPTDFWTIRRRLFCSYAVMILIMLGLGGYAFNRLAGIKADSNQVTQDCLPVVALLSQIDRLASRIQIESLKPAFAPEGRESE